MQHIHSLNDIQLKNAHATVGIFDGVHRGHTLLIKQLVDSAHRADAPAVVVSFHPHPAIALGYSPDLRYLTLPEERAELLSALGVDVLVTHLFDKNFSNLTALEFMTLLKNQLGLKYFLAGYDSALGKNREGNVARLTELSKTLDYNIEVFQVVQDSDHPISSSNIRKYIAEGNIHAANHLLGRSYALSGVVVHGDARGRTIGFPTANLSVAPEKTIPPNGVYACWAQVNGQRYEAAVSIGIRPTFANPNPDIRVEAYLLDFDKDIYDETLTLEFAARLRDELKFDSVEALVAQIEEDVQRTEDILK